MELPGYAGQNLTSPALAVSAGEVFELLVWHSAGASLNVEADSPGLVRDRGGRVDQHPPP
jgi:hypothetical protein